MYRARSATFPVVSHVPRSSSPTPTARSQGPTEVKRPKDRPRRMTVCGAYNGPRFQSPPQSKSKSIRSTTFDSPEQCPHSPAWSLIPRTISTNSAKSIQINESNDPTESGHYVPNTLKPSPRPILKHCEADSARLTSLFDAEAPLMAARAAIESILDAVVAWIKEFKPPTELDFSATTEQQPLVLADSIANKPFTDQRCKLTRLQVKLADIPTHGNEKLEDIHMATTAAIHQGFKQMKEYQLKLFRKAIMESKIAFDNILAILKETLQSFQLPSDLPEESDTDAMKFFHANYNKWFKDQFCKLDMLKVRLQDILTYGNPDLGYKYDEAGAAVEDAIVVMKKNQCKVWELSIAAKALDMLLRSVNASVSEFEYPSTLDFRTNAGHWGLSLPRTSRNQQFVKQFHVLQGFRDQLVRIETQGNEQLEKKHKEVSYAIGVSLQKLERHQHIVLRKQSRSHTPR